ncbi:hypothetical protein NL529_34265, partial [Klebsiella pneumoniae]|nr:hypothetical protein [Klebsiella pneumoniae]
MDFVESLIRHVAQESCNALQLPYGDHMLDFAKPFTRLSMRNAVLQYGKLSEADIEGAAIDAVLKKHA